LPHYVASHTRAAQQQQEVDPYKLPSSSEEEERAEGDRELIALIYPVVK
jgi:hypothetical protein